METAAKEATKKYLKNDTGNAERLRDKFGYCIRFIYETGTWMVLTDGGWVEDDRNNLNRMAKTISKQVIQEAVEGDETDKSLLAFGAKSGNKIQRKAMIDLAAMEKGVHTNIKEWDANHNLFNCKNGIFDASVMKFRERTENDLCIKQGNVAYDPNAACPLWEKCVQQWTCDDPELALYLQVMAGLALITDTSQEAVWFHHGGGANGKTVFFGVVTGVLGTYHTYTKFDMWVERKFGHSEHRSDFASLAGATRLVTSAESGSSHTFDEGVIKNATGTDPIHCRPLYGKWFNYVPQYRMWFMSNHEPIIKGTDWGIWRRVKKVPWDFTVSEDQKDDALQSKLSRESSGILNWMIDGLRWYLDHGRKLPHCKRVDEATAEYRVEMDIFGKFEGECLRFAGNATATASSVYKAYVDWCKRNEAFAMTGFTFHREFKKRHPKTDKFGWGDVSSGLQYVGVGVKVDGHYNLPEEVL